MSVSHEGIFGIGSTGAIGIRREEMHVHVRRQHLVLRPHVQTLASSLLPQQGNAASALSFCGWHRVSAQRGSGWARCLGRGG